MAKTGGLRPRRRGYPGGLLRIARGVAILSILPC